jgi:hypothetical protein
MFVDAIDVQPYGAPLIGKGWGSGYGRYCRLEGNASSHSQRLKGRNRFRVDA